MNRSQLHGAERRIAALADRIVTDGTPVVRSYRQAPGSRTWGGLLYRWAPGLGLAAAAAVLALILGWPGDPTPRTVGPPGVAVAVVPHDPLGALLAGPEPPTISAILMVRAP